MIDLAEKDLINRAYRIIETNGALLIERDSDHLLSTTT